jgi:hypothetical protein
MSYVCIIIGFGYGGSLEAPTIIDIEHVRTMVDKGGGISVVLTDIVKEADNGWMIVGDRTNLESTLRKLDLQFEPRLLIYYTGHGDVDSKMRLPNNSHFLLSDFRDFIAGLCDPGVELLFILDCCYSGGLVLPYYLSLDSCDFRISTLDRPAIPMILCLSSSLGSQRSAAVETHGSIFTKHLTAAISAGSNNLNTLSRILRSRMMAEGIDNEQTMSIHCSYPIPPVLWSWVTNKGVNVYINDPSSTIIIEKLE